MQPDQPKRCPATYPRPANTPPNTRIVHCHLEAGHPGEHEEEGTEVTWLPDDCCPGQEGAGDPRGLHSDDCPVYVANVAAWQASQPRPGPKPWPPQLPPPLTQAGVDAAYQRGLNEGRRQDVKRMRRLRSRYLGSAAWSAAIDVVFDDVLDALGAPDGPWEPAEQPERAAGGVVEPSEWWERLAQRSTTYADALEAFQNGDPARNAAAFIASAVLLHETLGEFLNGVRRGSAEQAEPDPAPGLVFETLASLPDPPDLDSEQFQREILGMWPVEQPQDGAR